MKTTYGFTLSSDKAGKDQSKANYANAYIGFGVENRKFSTGIYLEDARRAGIPVNDEIVPDENTVIFVVVLSHLELESTLEKTTMADLEEEIKILPLRSKKEQHGNESNRQGNER